jgi:hypothetical protein
MNGSTIGLHGRARIAETRGARVSGALQLPRG